MTQINKIVMHGFKSFARRTELVFGNDFNCILGPNGCGKSNVLDAICFVLGRMSAKSLRAEKSINLIYNGGKTKKSMKQGEVSIYFDNSKKTFPTEDGYVKVTRIVRQNSQSIYRINDQTRTRQQIVDLLSVAKIDPDGYNIILQGDIVRFTEMRPEDRRLLIEEIAGISIYEEKKQKALRELEKVEERLKEAEIILTERNTYLKELKKERDQAVKFKDLKSKVNENKASYLYIQIEGKEKEKYDLRQKIDAHNEKFREIQNKISEIKRAIEEKKGRIAQIGKEIEEKGEKEQVALHHDIEQLKVKLATNKTRIENCRGEIDKIDLRKQELQKELQEHKQQIEELTSQKTEISRQSQQKQEQLGSIDAEINNFKKRNEIDSAVEIEKEIEKIDKETEEKQKEIEEIRKQQQDLLRRRDYLEFQINSLDERIQKVSKIEKEHQSQIDELKNKKSEFKKTVEELNQRLNEDSSLAVQIGERKISLAKNEEKLAKLKAKNVSIKETVSGDIAIKKILDQKEIRGIYGTVSELGKVNEEFALALEIAAGPRIKSIVVESDKIAADCIKYLKNNKLGTAIFLPLNKIREIGISDNAKKLSKEKGVHGLAIDLISYDKKFEKVFSYVFGETLVVDDIDTARKIGVGKIKMVTLDGDLTEISGAMQGGFRIKKGRTIGFQQKEVLEGVERCESEIHSLKEAIISLGKRREENERLIESLREKRAALEGEVIKMEKSLHLEGSDLEATRQNKKELEKEASEIDNKIRDVQDKISGFNKILAQAKIKKQELRARISQLRNPALLAELNAFEDKKNELRQEIMDLNNELKNIDVKIKDIIAPEIEKISNILKQQDKEAAGFSTEISRLSGEIKKGADALKGREEKSRLFYAKYKELFAKRNKLSDEIQQEESRIEAQRDQSKDIEIKMNRLSLVNAEVSAKLAGLQEEFRQYEGVKINKEKSEQELKAEIAKFEKMVIEMGNVNMRALEIYEEIEKEYGILLEKKEKLRQEKEKVMGMMNEIEGRKKELFIRTFQAVNENFVRIFSDLSTKGAEASLVLENFENPFEGGLDIKVRLTGKKFLDIRSLSGGEKTMTALAFIFSIQEHEPHSFYVLDEVDAALDKHNSEKLAKLIRKYSENAQYLIISHNDGIISEADNLYGISMNEHGISTATSLKI